MPHLCADRGHCNVELVHQVDQHVILDSLADLRVRGNVGRGSCGAP